MKYSSTTIFSIVMIILCTVSIQVSWKHYLESSSRQQAKYNLKQIQVCVNDLVLGSDGSPIYNVHIKNDTIEKALKTCAREMKVSPTGDVFAYDLRTLEFIFDPSLDCFVEGGKFMTIESECNLHKDKQRCEQVMKIMNTGYDSDPHAWNWWKFNDNREYLEWVVLPNEIIGYDGVTRGGILKPRQVLVAQGVQEEELWNRYYQFQAILYVLAFFSIIFALLLSVHENVLGAKRNATQ